MSDKVRQTYEVVVVRSYDDDSSHHIKKDLVDLFAGNADVDVELTDQVRLDPISVTLTYVPLMKDTGSGWLAHIVRDLLKQHGYHDIQVEEN